MPSPLTTSWPSSMFSKLSTKPSTHSRPPSPRVRHEADDKETPSSTSRGLRSSDSSPETQMLSPSTTAVQFSSASRASRPSESIATAAPAKSSSLSTPVHSVCMGGVWASGSLLSWGSRMSAIMPATAISASTRPNMVRPLPGPPLSSVTLVCAPASSTGFLPAGAIVSGFLSSAGITGGAAAYGSVPS